MKSTKDNLEQVWKGPILFPLHIVKHIENADKKWVCQRGHRVEFSRAWKKNQAARILRQQSKC
jgi:hypothetical protein